MLEYCILPANCQICVLFAAWYNSMSPEQDVCGDDRSPMLITTNLRDLIVSDSCDHLVCPDMQAHCLQVLTECIHTKW